MTDSTAIANSAGTTTLASLGPDELKSLFSRALISMKIAQRADFIRALATEMRRVNMNIRAFLVPLGIPGSSPDELTPTEVGHLVRFLKINLPKAMPIIESVASRYDAFNAKIDDVSRRLAA